jgi:tetratricopeptide (TPR) repeat protein
MPILESIVALKAIVGIAGVASALYSNRNEEGNFDFGEFPKAFFGETFGGIVADCFRQGLAQNYNQLKAKYSRIQLDKDNLNHDLQKAARKSQLIATFFAAQYCLEQVKAENNSAETFVGKKIERAKGMVFTDSREAYLKEVINYLNDEIKNVENAAYSETLSFDEFVQVFDIYRQAVESGSQAEVSHSLKEDILRELELLPKFSVLKFDQDAFSLLAATIQTGWEELPPERVLSEHFVTLNISNLERAPSGKKYDWFYLVCSIFNEEYKNNPRIAAAAQRQLLLGIFGALETFGTITSDISTLTAKISDFAEELKQIREGIGRLEEGQTEIKDGVTEVNKRTARIEERLNTIAPEKSDSQNLVGLPSLRDKVYGREEELRLLNDFLERGKQFGIIIAPTCFGKTYLIKKFLQTIVQVGGVKSEYRSFVEKVIYLDCRENQTMTRILQSFANLLGKELKYQQSEEKHFLRDLFTKIQTEKILLIFDNFESWIDENGRYSVGQTSDGAAKDESIETFLNALFNSQHQIRGIFVSQKIPNAEHDFVNQVKPLTKVSDELEEGLKPQAALELARKEGANVGLNEVSEEALERFFQKVHYIPQAIQSMIGYLETVGESFAKFEREFWDDFDREERNDQNIENRLSNKLRPTKALIKRQILAQNETSKFLLSALAFFGVSVPKDALALSLIVTGKVESAADRSRAVKTLVDNRLVRIETDLVRERDAETGAEEEIIYFTLHPYLREIIREHLPEFEIENQNDLYSFAKALFDKGNESFKRNYYRKAIGFHEGCKRICEHLVFGLKLINVRHTLAAIYMVNGNSLMNLLRLDEAIKEYKRSIEIYEQLVNEENRLDLRQDLAKAYLNKGTPFIYLQRFNEATQEIEASIKILEQLVFKEGNLELRNDLATAYMNNGNALTEAKRLDKAIAEFEKSIKIREELVWQEKNVQLKGALARAYMNKGIALDELQHFDEAIVEFKESIRIFEELVFQEKQMDRVSDLAKVYMNNGNVLSELQRTWQALAEYDKGISLWANESALHNIPHLVAGLVNKNLLLIQLKDWRETAKNILFALQFIEILQHSSLSEHFKQSVGQNIGKILLQIKKLADKEKEEIYQNAGLSGENLRKLVDKI